MDLSVVMPVFNEAESLPQLVAELHAALDPLGIAYELCFIDDGSVDRSFECLRDLARQDPRMTVLQFRRNFGQTAAIQAGLDHARGDAIILMDADLQNDPADIPNLLRHLGEGYDMVAGWRHDRQDALLSRRLPSVIANRLISRTTGVHLHDYGCTLKAMTADIAKGLRLYGEMHRFIPAVANFAGARILEVKVNHRARQHGNSNYGLSRMIRVVLDLMVVLFIQAYLVRPMHVFGLAGLLSGLGGFVICSVLALQKFVYDSALADRPLLLLGVLLIFIGLQLTSIGLVADIVGRTYHEAQGKRPYNIRTVIGGEDACPRPSACESIGPNSEPGGTPS